MYISCFKYKEIIKKHIFYSYFLRILSRSLRIFSRLKINNFVNIYKNTCLKIKEKFCGKMRIFVAGRLMRKYDT
jgi:hypothetical protein